MEFRSADNTPVHEADGDFFPEIKQVTEPMSPEKVREVLDIVTMVQDGEYKIIESVDGHVAIGVLEYKLLYYRHMISVLKNMSGVEVADEGDYSFVVYFEYQAAEREIQGMIDEIEERIRKEKEVKGITPELERQFKEVDQARRKDILGWMQNAFPADDPYLGMFKEKEE